MDVDGPCLLRGELTQDLSPALSSCPKLGQVDTVKHW